MDFSHHWNAESWIRVAVIVVFNELFEAEALQISVKRCEEYVNMKHNDIPSEIPIFNG